MAKFKKLALLYAAILATGIMAVTSGCSLFDPIPDGPSSESSTPAEPETYTIKFVNDDGTVLQESAVEEGEMPMYNGDTPTKAEDAQFTYTFAGWDKTVVEATGEAIYTATYSTVTKKYTITFVDEDSTVLQSGEVEYGEVPVYTGDEPTKAGDVQYSYIFAGWGEVKAVTSEATYTATYTQVTNKYTVKFVNEDGTVLQSSEVEYGVKPVYEGTPTKAADAQFTYTFKDWDKEVVAVAGEVTYTATYTQVTNKYTVKFVNADGTVLQSSEVEYGTMPSYEGTPTMQANAPYSYVFIGWDKAVAAVTGDVTYTAKYDCKVLPEDAKDNFVDLEIFK